MIKTYESIEKCFCTEFCSWPIDIDIHISSALRQDVRKARKILKENPEIRTIALEVQPDFLKKECAIDLHRACRFDVDRILVGDIYVVYFIQSKWSATITAEYDLTHLLPHPVIVEFEQEQPIFDHS